ncbi:MAG TPA: hypothetical protein VH561_12580 [Micromonosporaceae bacterium]|jgi:hypothetical protein
MRVKILFVPLLASVALLVGCTPGDPTVTPSPVSNGVEDQSADQILQSAVAAMKGTSSFRQSGIVQAGPLSVTVDLVFAGDNVQGTGTAYGVQARLVKVGPDLYVNADASLFSTLLGASQQGTLDKISNTWVTAPADLVAPILPVPLSVDDVVSDIGSATPLTKGDPGTLNGTPVITVTDAGGTVYTVATVGEPYLLKTENGDHTVVYSDFNQSVTIEAPAGAIDLLAQLGLSS